MVKNWKAAFAAAVLSLSMFGAGAAFTASASAQTAFARGEYASARNIIRIKARLEGLIDQASRDQRDYGGHRVAAIADMQRARAQLQAAIDYDASHGH